ncbi:hypothetical protein Sa4125_39080 [Aureimonas sp. SA4125]|uniref:hypothetical protein n=1 Tax=Aureimonas sp. SA4125 TaxID=2826993 RepID=UPI001CC36DA6|nr:hypothetical protein [Aureimonas sp. SA4125]BDA86366.1 hypothetical protein Sa4125_39080 [Aureimonas sp. SA4125]
MTVDEMLQTIAARFDRAATAGPDCIGEAVAGLCGLLAAGLMPNDRGAPANVVGSLVSAIASAAPAVADAAHPRISPDAVYLGLAAASGFASLFSQAPTDAAAAVDPLLAADRIDHTALLADELDAVMRRRRIEERGDVFRRTITIRRALAAESAGALN